MLAGRLYPEHDTQIVQVCGQGYPPETELDPDNNRCSPCPFVEQATAAYKQGVEQSVADRLHYIFVPCNGSVVTDDMLGCNGHK